MHLTADELVDIAEGTRDLASVAHLRACEVCRRQVDMLRAALDVAAAADDVPEPSPLFWDHFSNRVRTAIATEPPASDAWWRRPWAAAVLTGAAMVAAVLIGMIATQSPRPAAPALVTPAVTTVAAREPLGDVDDSLALVADLTSDFDFDAAREAGLTGRGAADHAVTHLNDAELRELQQLLQEQMVSP